MPRLKKKWIEPQPQIVPAAKPCPDNPKPYFAIKDSENAVGVSKWIVYRMYQRGELQAKKLGHGKNAELFVKRSDFDLAWEKKAAA
jgi:hypothetical protein